MFVIGGDGIERYTRYDEQRTVTMGAVSKLWDILLWSFVSMSVCVYMDFESNKGQVVRLGRLVG